MSKPSDLPVWATDTDYPAGAEIWNGAPNKVEPTGGKQAEGWEPSERPAAEELNWWQNLVYQWCAYIDAGIWDGDLEVDGNLKVDGTSEFVDDIIATPNFSAGCTSDAAITATDYKFTAAKSRFISAIKHSQPDYLSGGSATHILVNNGSRWQMAASTNVLICPIELDVGDHFLGFEVYIEKNTTTVSSQPWHAQIYKVHDDGTKTAVGADNQNDEDAPGATFVAGTDAFTLADQWSYHIEITPPEDSGDFLHHTRIGWTRP